MERNPKRSRPRMVSRPSLGEIDKILAGLDLTSVDVSDEEKDGPDENNGSATRDIPTTKKLIKQEGRYGKYVNEYLLLEKLGKGAYAKVRVAKSMTDQSKYALKTFERSLLKRKFFKGKKRHTLMEDVFKEIAVMKKLDHPNVVKLYEVIDDPLSDKLHLVLELVPGGQVFAASAHVDPIEDHALIRSYFRDMILGVDYLHRNGIIHSDIKPENLLIDGEGNMKLADFGTSVMLQDADDSFISSVKGTPAFTAPETCGPSPAPGERRTFDGFAVDVWAMGVSLYMFVTGTCPFAAETPLRAYDKIQTYDPPMPENVDERLIDLLQRILQKNPAERITIPEMMEHPWITADGTEPLSQINADRGSVVVDSREIDEAVNLESHVVHAGRHQDGADAEYFVVTNVDVSENASRPEQRVGDS